MYSNFFNPCEGRQQAQMSDEAGRSGHGPGSQGFGNNSQTSFQGSNWNGLSPLNKDNQLHYQRIREQAPSDYDGDEWPAADIESAASLNRKRNGSPQWENSRPSKRVQGGLNRSEFLTPQRQRVPHSTQSNALFVDRGLNGHSIQQYKQQNSLGRYSHTEFQLPPPFETKPRSYAWMGLDIANGKRWGSAESGGFSQIFPPKMPLQQLDFHVQQTLEHNEPIIISGGSSSNFRRGQTVMPDVFRDSPRMAVAKDGRQGYRAQSIVDLVTPESVPRQRHGAQTSTNSGSSELRKVTETEPTDLDGEDWDSDIKDYKSARFQSYVPVGGVTHNSIISSGSRLRGQSVMPGSGNAYTSRIRQSFNDGRLRNSQAFGSFRSQQFTAFGPALKPDETNQQNTQLREPPHQPAPNSLHQSRGQTVQRKMDVEQDPVSDENDTIEETMRKEAWKKKVKAARKPSSRKMLSKNINFGSGRRSTSGHSSQEVEANVKAREEHQESILARIRGPDSSKTNKHSNLNDVSMVDGDMTRHIVTKQTTAQKATALEKEKAELQRQKLAEETIAHRQKEAQRSKDIDDLFEEPPIDERALARIKRSKELDKERRYAAEKAKIVKESDKITQEKLAALSKKKAAEEEGEKQVEKKQRIEEKRQQDAMRDEERLMARRKSAAEIFRRKTVMEEETRLEGLGKLEAERQATKKRMATLQSFKKEHSKASAIQRMEPQPVGESGNLSDGGMFVPDEVVPLSNGTPEEQPINGVDKEVIEQPANVQDPEAVTVDDKPESGQKPDDIAKNADIILPVEAADIQQPDTITGKSEGLSPAALSVVQKPDTLAAKEENPATRTISTVEKPEIVVDTPSSASKTSAQSVKQTQTAAATISCASILVVASDGRRRPPELPKPRVSRHISPDSIRFTSGGRSTSQKVQDSNQTTNASMSDVRKKSQNKNINHANRLELKLQKSLKDLEDLKAKAQAEEVKRSKEWDARMKQLGAFLIPQDREDIAAGCQRTSSGKKQNVTSEVGKHGQSLPSSKIEFVSQIKSQVREKQKAEAARIAKYERDKATCRKRYDREIRIVLTGQGIELDDEKISKQVEEKMVVWEENRRKRERRESGGKNLFASLSHPDGAPTSDVEQNPTSLPTLQNTDDEGVKDAEARKESVRAQTIRAGVEFLASQNKANSDFTKAASKFRIQDFESDESEEDSDDEPEEPAVPVNQPTFETSEEMVDAEIDETLNPAALDASIIPSLPEILEPPKSKTAFLPDIVNPKEEDIMHSYSVRHRAERGSNVYDSVVLGRFHSLEEANAFARQKLSEFYLGPSTGKSETHNDDNLYVGQVITNKSKGHSETVWVTREIVYIGDTANVKRGDIKTIIAATVYNVLQVMQDGDGNLTGSVVVTASIKALANKKAADLCLALSRPSRPRMDSMMYYNETVIPLVRGKLAEAEAKDVTMEFEGRIPDTERDFTISISENPVVGPLN